VKAAEPSKPTAKELRIFSLLDDSHLAEAKALIESDPKTVNVEDDDGVTALAVIANEQDETINVGYGLQGTISDNAIGARVPLVADLLIAKGADVNAVDKRGGTPLIWAINGDKPGLAKLLIRNCADVNFTLSARGEEGMTPLHFAAGHGDIDITRDLISSGAKIDVKNKNGETPLFNAAQYGHYLVVDLLLQKGASAGTRDASGRSPLKAAEDNGIDSFRRDRLAAVLQGKGTTK
jgi:ankyrin repeat protein